jgi:1-acyl-sn-glycerol-3-phosphate acyltransferase
LSTSAFVRRVARTSRSLLFFAVYGIYLVSFFGLGQRLVIWPLTLVLPGRRRDIVGAWFYLLARNTLSLARVIADVRVEVQGSVPFGSCVVLMNHQSLLDIPIAYSLVRRPYPVIPTRDVYHRGIPGTSPLIRLGGLPLVTQKIPGVRQDLKAIAEAADAVAAGQLSFLIYPEGHRTRDGEIAPFMTAGLRAVLPRAERPVYLIVVDGLAHSRTMAESLLNFAGSRGQVRVVGPFTPDPKDEVKAVIEDLRSRMVATLAEMRA